MHRTEEVMRRLLMAAAGECVVLIVHNEDNASVGLIASLKDVTFATASFTFTGGGVLTVPIDKVECVSCDTEHVTVHVNPLDAMID